MGRLIEVVFDPTYKPAPLELHIAEPTPDQFTHNNEVKKHEIDQTKVYGIQVPLIAINDIFIDFDDIVEFSLKSEHILPSVTFTVRDKYGLIENVQTPSMDNEIRIDILPKFDNAYKKIELTFYMESNEINGNELTIYGIYKYSELTDSKFESFGEVTTYDLINDIATKTKLGFASNALQSASDKRYVYCDYKSFIDIMDREVDYGGNENEIYDVWVDFWNYIVLADIKERYNSIDSDGDIKIWVAKHPDETGISSDIIPMEVVAMPNNHPSSTSSELFVSDFELFTSSGIYAMNGTDKVYSIFEDNLEEHKDLNVMDGDVKKDVFTNFEYIGETYSEHNYLRQRCIRETFLQKMNTEYIQIHMNTPLLGITRGSKVNFIWYKNDDLIKNKINDLSNNDTITNYDDIQSNIPLPNSLDTPKSDNGVFIIDRAISGQYLVTACEISYFNNKWDYILTINRPANQKPDIINAINNE